MFLRFYFTLVHVIASVYNSANNLFRGFYLKKTIRISKTDALIIEDVQKDFCPGGALPVSEGDQVIPALNDYLKIFEKANAEIFATRDWHPPNHISFKAQGGLWPPHCVQNTEGAKFHPALKLPRSTKVVSKAMNPLKENYSSFDGAELSNILKKQGVTRVFVGGLATDYCVKCTVIDALKLGFKAVLLSDAIRGINVGPNDAETAIAEMIKNGAEQVTLDNFPEPLDPSLSKDSETEVLAEKPLARVAIKKKARMRPRGRYKRIRAEK